MKSSYILTAALFLTSNFLVGPQAFAQKAFSDIDIQGIKMGMSPDQVMPIVQKLPRKPGAQIRVQSLQLGGRDPASGQFVPLKNGKVTIRIANGPTEMNSISLNDSDEISVNFVAVPDEQNVAAIYRRSALKAGARPLSENFVKDILAKYGKPTFEKHINNDFLVWSFSSTGEPLKSWAGEKCLLGFPKTSDVVTDPTNPSILWTRIIEREWMDKLIPSYYKACGTKLLIIELMNDVGTKTTQRVNFIFYDIEAIINGSMKANKLMNEVSQSSKNNMIKNASQVKPSL